MRVYYRASHRIPQDGAPVLTREAPRPIFASTSGRLLVSSSLTVFDFTSIRGTPLDRLGLNFAHVNLDRPGCDSMAGGDCSVERLGNFHTETAYIVQHSYP